MAIKNMIVGTTATDIRTAGVGETSAVLCIIFCNEDVVARTITVASIPAGGTSRTLLSVYSIPAGDTFIWTTTEKLILAAGDQITALASAKTTNEVIATVSYYNL